MRQARALTCPSCGGPLDPDGRACPHCRVTLFTRRCALCFDLNLAGDRNCRRCGRILPEEDDGARAERIACPGCGARMTPRTAGQTGFDECDRCGGLWLSPRTVEGMAEQAETRALLRAFDPPAPGAAGGAAPPAGAPPKITYRKCPACGKLMNRLMYAPGAGVIVDACRDHGSYFDRGELTRIFTFVENGGLEKARRREAEALKEELRDLRRKAVAAGNADSSLPLEMEPSPAGATLFDLLGWLASRLMSGGK